MRDAERLSHGKRGTGDEVLGGDLLNRIQETHWQRGGSKFGTSAAERRNGAYGLEFDYRFETLSYGTIVANCPLAAMAP
jgi:hypothetical protein